MARPRACSTRCATAPRRKPPTGIIVSRRSRSRAVVALVVCASVAGVLACDSLTPRFEIGKPGVPAETLQVVAAPNVFTPASVQASPPNTIGGAERTTVWSSSDERVAVVNGRGMVVGRAPGRAVVHGSNGNRFSFASVQVVTTPEPPVRIIAHRGFMRKFPENTLVAVKGAFDDGADGVEVDIRLAADHVPVVMHDATVDRTTDGRGAVDALTSSELAGLNACAHWAGPPPPCSVPLMSQVLEAAHGRGEVLLHLYGNYDADDLRKLLDMVRKSDMDRDAIFISFDYPVLLAIRQLDPVVALGFLTTRPPDPRFVAALGRMAPVVELQAAIADSTAMRGYLVETRRRQQEAGVWVAWNQTQAKQAFALGFRTIIADVPIDRAALP